MIFRACVLKFNKLCFSFGIVSMLCVCLLAMTQKALSRSHAEQTQQARVSDFGLWAICDEWLKGVADPGSFCSTKVTKSFVVPVWCPSPEIKILFSVQTYVPYA